MKNYEEKEKKLDNVLKKLNTMSNRVIKMNNDINSLNLEKNQLLREKEESEKNFQNLSKQHQELKSELEKINNQMHRINSYDAIIIAKPKASFNMMYKYLIDQYIMNGGRIIWLLDGTNAANMNNFAGQEFTVRKDSLLLNDILLKYGAKINHNLIQDTRCTKNIILKNENEWKHEEWQYNPLLISKQNHIISSEGDSILTQWVSSIKILKPDKTTILLSSSDKSNVLNEGENVSLNIINYPPNTFEGKKTVAVLIEDEFNTNFLKLLDTKELKIKRKSLQNKMIIISDGDIIANLYKYDGI